MMWTMNSCDRRGMISVSQTAQLCPVKGCSTLGRTALVLVLAMIKKAESTTVKWNSLDLAKSSQNLAESKDPRLEKQDLQNTLKLACNDLKKVTYLELVGVGP